MDAKNIREKYNISKTTREGVVCTSSSWQPITGIGFLANLLHSRQDKKTPVFLSFFSFSPISYTQDKTRQHLSLFLSCSLVFLFSNILHLRKDQTILFISFFSPPHLFSSFSQLFLIFAFACVTLVY